uniref:TBC1 domain family, member 10b n=1 Tax=Cyprinus carpio TaxID=7962 RepID=A0A8C1K4M3_CYPCA
MGNPTLQASGKISSSWESTPGKNSGALSSTAAESAAGPPEEVLASASLMSGTLESLSGLGDDCSSLGSDSEINGPVRRTDKYGFLGGAQYSESSEAEIAVAVARQREMKWLDMFRNWDKWISRRFQKVKMRCRKGIPCSLRSKAWQLLSNSQELLDSNPGKFEELEQEQGDPKWLDIIEKDLHRQFPFHEMFAARGGHGQQDLYRILKAYTVYRPDEGYCQAQAPVAAVLLMHMPAEQAFWCLVQICEKYLPGYYSAGLEAIQLDGEIFFSLLRRVCPMAYRHLKKFKIDPILYMTEWFMCIFSRTLPWSCVLHVWDMFFCEGVKIVFRVGLVLLKQMLGSVDKLRELQGMYETMERLRNIPPECIREDVLVQEVVSLSVTEALIERECSVQVRKWRVSRGVLTHQPSRRLHGTRAIFEITGSRHLPRVSYHLVCTVLSPNAETGSIYYLAFFFFCFLEDGYLMDEISYIISSQFCCTECHGVHRPLAPSVPVQPHNPPLSITQKLPQPEYLNKTVLWREKHGGDNNLSLSVLEDLFIHCTVDC